MQYDENAEKYGYEGEMTPLKCDKLTAYKGDVTIPVYGTIADAQVYLKKDVDAAIAELKDKVKFCSDFELAARKDIEEMRGQHQMLKQFGHYHLSPVPGKMINHEVRQYVSYNVVCLIIKHLESENTELKQKLEDVQASMYCDVVDANIEIRRLKRALWIARARSAHNAAMMWEILSDEYLNGAQFTIDFRCVGDPGVTEFQMFRGCMDWMKIYENVERKCRAKAEEYK